MQLQEFFLFIPCKHTHTRKQKNPSWVKAWKPGFISTHFSIMINVCDWITNHQVVQVGNKHAGSDLTGSVSFSPAVANKLITVIWFRIWFSAWKYFMWRHVFATQNCPPNKQIQKSHKKLIFKAPKKHYSIPCLLNTGSLLLHINMFYFTLLATCLQCITELHKLSHCKSRLLYIPDFFLPFVSS